MSKFNKGGLPHVPFFEDRWLFILLAILLSVLAIFTSGLQKGPTRGDQYNVERARVLETDDSNLSDEPYIKGMRIGSQMVTLEIRSGAHTGERFKVENIMSRAFNIDCRPGLNITCNVRETNGTVDGVDIFGYNRETMIFGLAGLFLAILLFIGRKKGLYSAISLVFTIIIILFFMVPKILQGYNPVTMAGITAIVTTAVAICIVSGWNNKSIAAIIGILGGVLASGLVAFIAGKVGNLSGMHLPEASEVIYLAQEVPIKVPGILTAGVIISALGAIMDVAITISSSIFEVRAANTKMGVKELYNSGMNVGKDAMGTMSNTLILAFAGSSLSVLIIIMLYNLPYLRLINIDLLGVEFLQGLAGSIGLTLTVPITALCAAVFAAKAKRPPSGG